MHLAEEPRYALNFLWLDKNIGVAVDQVFAKVCAAMKNVTGGPRDGPADLKASHHPGHLASLAVRLGTWLAGGRK